MNKIDTQKLYTEIYKADGHNYGSYNENEHIDSRVSPQLQTIKYYIEKYSLLPNSLILEIGCGLGHLNVCHPNWMGFEYSKTAIDLAKSIYGQKLNITEADARNLPLPSDSVDFLFSFAALEHIPEVEKAFSEIERVLKPNGIAVLCPAWNCRTWTVKKLEQRSYTELSVSEKIGKFLIPLRNNLFFRLLCAMPSRLYREQLFLVRKQQVKLQYRKLSPDFSLWEKYEHISDDDAFVSIDAHAALVYFISRNWRSDSHSNFIKRLSCRGNEIVVRKPNQQHKNLNV